jgi:hypothetical protein
MILSVVAPNSTQRQIGVILGQMFQRFTRLFPMKIAVTLSVMLLVVGSAKFSGAQEPSPTPDASPIATPTPTPTPTASPTPTAKPTSTATPRPPTGLRVLQ